MARNNNGPMASGPERALGYVPPVRGTIELILFGIIIGSIANHPWYGALGGLIVAALGYGMIGRSK